MTPEQLAKEIHVLRDEENDSSDNGTYPWAGMPEGYRKNWTRVAQSLLDKYDIKEKAKALTLEEKREQVRRGNPDLVRYGGKRKDAISLDPPTANDTKGRTYKL